ncbi:MAG: metalloregulator ArsR/SmtB family transcription factor [Cellulomonas sp.]
MGAPAATHVAAVLKALADPLRLRMVSLIATSPTGEACVCDLATVADVTQPTVSHHLKVLKDIGVLTSERRATWVFYRIDPRVRRGISTLLEAFAPDMVATDEHHPETPGLTDVDHVLERIAAQLAARYPALGDDLVTQTVRESYAALARGAGVRSHLVATTERFARQRLDDLLRARLPAGTPTVPQVLFVCVANAGRSQLAAALLRHYAGDAVTVRSAGSAPADDVHEAVRAILADLTDDADGADGPAYPKPLTDDAVRAADVVITMGCGDKCPVLPGTRYEDWIVGDPALASPDGVRAIRDELDTRVRALLADLMPAHDRPAS